MANNRELSQFANVVGYNGGNIGIGTDNPQQKLHLSDTTSANIYLQTHNSGTGSTAGVYFRTSDSSTADGFFKTAIVLEDDGTSWARGKLHILQDNTTDNSNATLDDSVLTIDQSGRLLVGHDSNTTPYVAGKVQVSATDSSAALSIARYQNTASNPYLALVKSRGGLGNATIVQDNDGLGYITFVGADGNDLTSEGAAIAAEVDGTPGQDDMPGALIFKTTSDGSNSASERLRITSAGSMGLGTSSPDSYVGGGENLVIADSSDAGMTIASGTTNSGTINFADGASGDARYRGRIEYSHSLDALDILTAATTQIRITSDGKVAIGTLSHDSLIHGKVSSGGATLTLESTATSGEASVALKGKNSSGTVRNATIKYDNSDRYRIAIVSNIDLDFETNDTGRMRLNAHGGLNVGGGVLSAGSQAGNIVVDEGIYINSYNGDYQIRANSAGSGSATLYIGNAAISTSSDRRLKENIVDTVVDAAEELKRVRVVDFTWNDPSDTSFNNRNARGTWTGVIAQELVNVFPFVVNAPRREEDLSIDQDSEKRWLVDQDQLVPVLIKAFQQSLSRIETLETQNTDLLARVTALENP